MVTRTQNGRRDWGRCTSLALLAAERDDPPLMPGQNNVQPEDLEDEQRKMTETPTHE